MTRNYEAALAMYSREHDRWNQWALFFFGAIGAIFFVASYFTIPMYVPSTFASVVSLMWVLVASSIRATTDCWRDTLREYEEHPESTEGAFHVFDRRLKAYDYYADFKQTLRVWDRLTYTSVTRILVWSGMSASLAFVLLGILNAMGSISGALR